MTDTITKGDFVELDYTGRTDEGELFDTTIKAVADQEHLHAHKHFRPVIVCIGEGHLLPVLDHALIGKALGKHEFTFPDAFGKKSAKLLQLIPRRAFKDQDLRPVPGLEITVDNQTGIIRSVSGGRIIVDFNHPLASKTVRYELDVKRKVTDPAERIGAVLDIARIPHGKVIVEENKATVAMPKGLPQELLDVFAKDLVRLTGVADVTFTVEGEKNNKV